MELWTAFFLGLAGSLHCAGMCGPIALSIPSHGFSKARFVISRLAYNAGRLTTYCMLGAVFGMAGKGFAILGWQRAVSIFSGVGILTVLLFQHGWGSMLNSRITKPVTWFKRLFARQLSHPSLRSTYFLGSLNGFLPCGLVYAACVSAIAAGSAWRAVETMALFGLGTVPMMAAISLAGKKLQFTLRFKLQKLIPVTLVIMSLLLILRGMALGIPHLSPGANAAACH